MGRNEVNNQRKVVFQKVEGKSRSADDQPDFWYMHQECLKLPLTPMDQISLCSHFKRQQFEMDHSQKQSM